MKDTFLNQKDQAAPTKPYQTVIALLPMLSLEERERVKKALGALGGLAASGPTNGDSDVDLVLHAIVSHLSARGAEHASVGMLKKSPQFNAFKVKIPAVVRFFCTKNRTELNAFLNVAIPLLYDDLTEMGIAVSARTLLVHIHRLPATINKHFPRYASSGMLHLLLKKKEDHVREKSD